MITTYYLSPATYYLLPTYPPPTNYYLLPTYYLLLMANYLLINNLRCKA